MKVFLKNEYKNHVKVGHVGFSWTTLFFGFWVALFRKDWKIFIPVFLIYIGNLYFSPWRINMMNGQIFIESLYVDSIYFSLMNILSLLFNVAGAFCYNKIYTKNLVKKGYLPVSPEGEALLQLHGISTLHKG